ncbi:MAG: hypothetical protein U9P14_05335 [Gemmatimonadota bacterium]|nr:hypothetical protein [Gemmatimonadota bacterium]
MKEKHAGKPRMDMLDRVVEVMRHFLCADPRELEYVLGLPEDTLAAVFHKRAGGLPEEVIEAMVSAGVRREYLLLGAGSMLSETVSLARLEVMKRHLSVLMRLICRARDRLSRENGGTAVMPLRVADGRPDPVAIDEELINLLLEALRDKGTRERLVQFIRSDLANRKSSQN